MSFTVLVVDDSKAMRGFIRRVIDLSGFEYSQCLEASDGKEALDLLAHETVDIILTDINMPEMNGEEFLRRVEEDAQFSAIPVLVVSTDATENRIREMMSIGAKGYLTKPFVPEDLRVQLERVAGVDHG